MEGDKKGDQVFFEKIEGGKYLRGRGVRVLFATCQPVFRNQEVLDHLQV